MRIPWALQKITKIKIIQLKMSRIIRIFLKMIFMQPSYHENLSSRKFRGTSSLKTPQLRFLEYFTIICLTHVKLCFKLVTSLRCLWNFLQSITFLCHSLTCSRHRSLQNFESSNFLLFTKFCFFLDQKVGRSIEITQPFLTLIHSLLIRQYVMFKALKYVIQNY